MQNFDLSKNRILFSNSFSLTYIYNAILNILFIFYSNEWSDLIRLWKLSKRRTFAIVQSYSKFIQKSYSKFCSRVHKTKGHFNCWRFILVCNIRYRLHYTLIKRLIYFKLIIIQLQRLINTQLFKQIMTTLSTPNQSFYWLNNSIQKTKCKLKLPSRYVIKQSDITTRNPIKMTAWVLIIWITFWNDTRRVTMHGRNLSQNENLEYT